MQIPYRIIIERGDKFKEKENAIYCFRLYGDAPKLNYDEQPNPSSMNKMPEP